MKKIIFLITLVFTMALTFVSAFGALINTRLYYDGALHDYSAEEITISINGEMLSQYTMFPVILNSRTLVPARDVFEKMGCEVLWNDAQKRVSVKKGSDTILININSDTAYKNNVSFKIDSAAKIINDRTMIPLRAVSEAMGCQVEWNNAARSIAITYSSESASQAATESVSETTTEAAEAVQEVYQSSSNKKEGGIKIVWDQITNVNANNADGKRDAINGLDVISPTWFSIKNSDGDINDIGSVEYVQWAHNSGYQVWGLVTNSFDSALTHSVLSDSNKRLKVINHLSALADKYSLDGINIDFESVGSGDGDFYLAFIKEATAAFKEKGLIVSVDTFIIKPWNVQYKVKEVSQIVDYVIVMTYDEHWSSSPEAGSVASIGWVDDAMQDMVEAVDKNKLIMGMPFYTRLWAESDGKVSSTAYTMQNGYENLVENNADIVWNEECGQYYGEYTKDGVRYRMWLEDERSIEEKLKVSRKYDVKGVACWKRGHEKSTVWDIINNYY